MKTTIVGAGLAGLIAACLFDGDIYEAAEAPAETHKALLRFRTDAVAKVTGIPFKKVTVRKGIWFDGRFHEPDIRLANLYSRKVLNGQIMDRSIWNLEPVERWIAPMDFYQQLVRRHAKRIRWGTPWDFGSGTPVVSTAPLPIVLDALKIGAGLEFKRAPITVVRLELPFVSDVYQTVYFPASTTPIYRASITDRTLICEFVEDAVVGASMSTWIYNVIDAFGLPAVDAKEVIKMHCETVSQRYGKIAPIPSQNRKALLHKLTRDHNIFSLGRFATWRNILLDDVVKDIDVLKRLMAMDDYERTLEISQC